YLDKGCETLPSDSACVQRTQHLASATVQDVGVDHRRRDVAVAHQFLDRPDVVDRFEEVRGERAAQRVAGRVRRDPGDANGLMEGALQHGLVKMMSDPLTKLRMEVRARGG